IRNIPNICTNHRTQGYIATKHLIDKGCRKIGYFHLENHRYEGFQDALKETGLPLLEDFVYNPGPSQRPATYLAGAAKDAVDYWVSKDSLPDGIIAQSDHQAAG